MIESSLITKAKSSPRIFALSACLPRAFSNFTAPVPLTTLSVPLISVTTKFPSYSPKNFSLFKTLKFFTKPFLEMTSPSFSVAPSLLTATISDGSEPLNFISPVMFSSLGSKYWRFVEQPKNKNDSKSVNISVFFIIYCLHSVSKQVRFDERAS